MPDGARWALINAKKRLAAAEAEAARLREQVERLRGLVLDLGGDPDA